MPLLATEARLRLARIALLAGDLERAGELANEVADEARRQRRGGSRDHAVLIGVESRLRRGEAGASELVVARRAAGRFERAGNLHSAVEAYLVAGRVALDIHRDHDAVERSSQATGSRGRAGARAPSGRVAGLFLRRAEQQPAAALATAARACATSRVHRSRCPRSSCVRSRPGHGAELGRSAWGLPGPRVTGRALAWMERTRAAALLAPAPASAVPLARAQPGDVTASGHAGPGRRAGGPAGRPRGDWPASRSGDAAPPVDLVGLAELRTALDERTLVEFGKLRGPSGRGRRRASSLPARGARRRTPTSLDELRPLLFALRRLANPRGAAASGAARASADLRIGRLRALLFAPLGLAADAEVVVVPVGVLHGVPWSCLHDGPLAQAPSATFWVRTQRAAAARAHTGRTVLVAGPELDGAREEVVALEAVHPGAQMLMHEESHGQAVVAALADADLAHLACHGTPRADNPMFSSLLLSDGPVTVQELHGAGVAPHRLILASCHSGADVAYSGDEVLGFVSAMLSQGTAGVVASIAAVPDVAAVDLMLGLHRGLARGLTLARALHEARGAVDRTSPEGFVNWCTFSAHGAA